MNLLKSYFANSIKWGRIDLKIVTDFDVSPGFFFILTNARDKIVGSWKCLKMNMTQHRIAFEIKA